MKAMLFAAGQGTRLRPLTNSKPKALVNVAGKSLLEWNLRKLYKAGIRQFVINVHHFGEQVIRFVEELDWPGLHVQISDERKALLDTGGGLWKASGFFGENEDVLVHNVDILTNLDIAMLMKAHRQQVALVTLAVKDRDTDRKLLFDDTGQLVGWRNRKTGEVRWSADPRGSVQAYAYSGVHVINTAIFALKHQTGAFPLIPVYLDLAAEHPVKGFVYEGAWLDVGKPGSPEIATDMLQQEVIKI